MIQALATCQRDTFMQRADNPCPTVNLYPDHGPTAEIIALEDVPAAMAERLRAEGWVTIDGEHYCPRHTPDMIGNVIAIPGDYAPLVHGWEARVPDGEQRIVLIEIRKSPTAPAGE